jgi:hypothetical protein
MVSRGTFYGVVVVLVVLLLFTSTLAAIYYSQYQQEVAANNKNVAELQRMVSKYGDVLTSDILIDFGNGTGHWYNGTQVQPGWNLYTVTLAVTNGNVNATCCAFGSHFVTGIDGVQNLPSEDKSWFNWTYNSTSLWQLANAGADQIQVFNGSVFGWTYCAYDPNTYAPNCSPSSP